MLIFALLSPLPREGISRATGAAEREPFLSLSTPSPPLFGRAGKGPPRGRRLDDWEERQPAPRVEMEEAWEAVSVPMGSHPIDSLTVSLM